MYEIVSDDIQALRAMIRELLGWATTSCCSDCDTFREAPSRIDWIHHKDCGHLASINKALALLGREPDEGHNYEDPKKEMERLHHQRLIAMLHPKKDKP
jgi:hypothetical protein